MSKGYDVDVRPGIPLRQIHNPGSEDSVSANNSDFDHLLSDDVSVASSSTELPPVDGGRGAWLCLLGCCLAEAMIWGFALSFGVFERHYSSLLLFKDSSSIPSIGTLAIGVSFLGMPFANPVALGWPQHRRKMSVTGWCICLLGLAAASLATTTSHLLAFQGLLYGVGWCICYTPFWLILNEWWVEKRGMAYGILFAASGVSGTIIPFVLDWMLESYGFRIALRAYGVMTIAISGPGLLLIQHRQPPTRHFSYVEKSQTEALRVLKPIVGNLHFLLLAGAAFLQGLVFFIPNIFIPSFSEVLGLSSTSSAGLLAIISLFQVFGQLCQNWVSNRVNVYIPASISAFASAVAAFFLWGLAKGVAWLLPFAILWGFFSASYSALYIRMVSFLLNDNRENVPINDRPGMLLYGFFSFDRGVANILAGPISSLLIAAAGKKFEWERIGLGKYRYLVWFTILCMLASALVGVGWRRRHRGRPGVYPNT